MKAKAETWCDRDEHYLFEHFSDFNEWLDNDDSGDIREIYGIDGLSRPSKALSLLKLT